MSNLKQVGLGMMMYVEDYDEVYPFTSSGRPGIVYQWPTHQYTGTIFWYAQIQPYVKSVQLFNCPSAESRLMWEGGYDRGSGAWGNISYGANPHFFHNYGYADGPVKMASVDKVSQTAIITDANSYAAPPYIGDGLDAGWNSAASQLDRHFGGANIAFADGHVKWLKYQHRPADCAPLSATCRLLSPGTSKGVYWYADGRTRG